MTRPAGFILPPLCCFRKLIVKDNEVVGLESVFKRLEVGESDVVDQVVVGAVVCCLIEALELARASKSRRVLEETEEVMG